MAVDFRELEAFRDKIQQIGQQGASQLCDDCTKELAARLLAKVIKRTPKGVKYPYEYMKEESKETVEFVTSKGRKRKFLTAKAATYQQIWNGYVGGTLQRGWTAGRDINAAEYIAGMPVNVLSREHRINIINQVAYASYVEYGHRQTPGRYVPAIGRRLKESWVQGTFMLKNSVAELDAKAQEIVERKVKEYLEKELGHE